jgi:hypothetical protein
MSISNYGELKTAFQNWLSRDTLTARIPEFIRLGEHRLYSELRVRFMEATESVAVNSGNQESSIPTRYLQMRSIYIAGPPHVRPEFRTPAEFWAIYANLPSAKPRYFTIERSRIEWGPIPDASYTAECNYYQEPVVLLEDADTNGLFSLAPNLLLYAGLIETAPFLGNDPRILVWSAMYDDLLEKIQLADRRDRSSGDAQVESRQAQLT